MYLHDASGIRWCDNDKGGECQKSKNYADVMGNNLFRRAFRHFAEVFGKSLHVSEGNLGKYWKGMCSTEETTAWGDLFVCRTP